MNQVYPSGANLTADTLGSNETSQKLSIHKTGSLFVYAGGTFSSQTLTMQFSADGGTTWATFAVDLNGSGTGTDQTWDGSGDVNPRRYVVGPGMQFRFTVSSGGSPAISVYVYGDHYTIDRAS